jgi:hypothetical protein
MGLLGNSVSCAFLGLEEPSTNGQAMSKRKLTPGDKEKYAKFDPNARFFIMRPPGPPKLPPPVIEINPEVKKQIDILIAGKQRSLRENLERGKNHAKIINQVLIDEGVPGEFIYLAMIESGYQPTLKSPMGASGMWQFMKSTARLYGLRVDLFHDERKDIILSTIAAGRHLKDLYDEFGDWSLVLAAYNAGPGAVEKAVKHSQSRDFWKLASKGNFRQETICFVAKFYAINFIMAKPESFGLDLNCLTSYKGLNHSMKIRNSLKTEIDADQDRPGN